MVFQQVLYQRRSSITLTGRQMLVSSTTGSGRSTSGDVIIAGLAFTGASVS
jgi:hypothetical protein